MSGQAGIYYFDQRPIDRALENHLGAGLATQGPDGGAEHFGPGLLMVYRAFNFDPLSRSEKQPYRSAKGDWITFDGRLDNRDDLVLLVGDLLSEQKSDSKTDVALALAAYEKWGEQGLNRLIGDWSVVIWDQERRNLVLASDYMGVRPLFYTVNKEFIAWSSDLAMLTAWMKVEDNLDNSYIAAYLQGNPTYDRTIYDGISYVPCGHSVRAEEGLLSKTQFWHLPVEGRIRYRTTEEYAEHLLHLFREAVQSRLRTDGVVCCDLSGGLDSSSVVCMAHHLIQSGSTNPEKLMTFSWDDPTMDDIRFIPVVEQHCGIEGIHREYRPHWSLAYPAGTLPGYAVPLWTEKRNALCRHAVRVSMSGLGGDDVLGNVPDDTDQLADYIQRRELRFFKEAYAWSRAMRVPIWEILKRGLVPFLRPERQQQLWKRRTERAYNHLPKVSCLKQEFLTRYGQIEASANAFEYRLGTPGLRKFFYGISQIQNRRLTAAHHISGALKPSHPYYHRPLLEFIARVPRSEICQPECPRRLMRRSFVGLLPPTILNRSTKGLAGTAMDLSAQDLVPALLQGSVGFSVEQHGCANGTVLQRILQDLQSTGYRREEFHRVLSLEIWFRTRRVANSLVADRPFDVTVRVPYHAA
jgi:asparagine synthase (glutamine-hydrolysing)